VPASAGSYGRGARIGGVGIAATALVTQAYFSLASHSLGKDDYGGISLLWTSIFLVCSILYRPVEQLLSRTIADRDARGVRGHEHLRVAATIQLALGLVFLVAALALRGPVEDDLFGGSSALYWVLVIAVPAYAASYFARGFLAGHKLLHLYGLLVFVESVARTAFAVLAVVGVATSQSFVAAGMAAAPILSLSVVPWALGRRIRTQAAVGEARDVRAAEAADMAALEEPPAEAEFTLAHGAGFATAVLLIMVCEQAFLNAGPLIVKGSAGSGGIALAGFAFNVVLIARAPLQLFQAIQTAILPHLTELSAGADVPAFRRSVAVTVRAIAAFGAAVSLALLAIGPFAMHVLFGDKGFDYDRLGLVAIGVGMALYLCGATLNQAALALGRAAKAAVCWVLSATVYVVFLLIPGWSDRVLQLEVGFLVGAAILCALLYALYRRELRSPAARFARRGTPPSPPG
jgi:O-antigen/teichoic acid export membrane protein